LRKIYSHDNYWINIISIPNGNYKIVAKDKLTTAVLATIDIKLVDNYLKLDIEDNNGNIIFNVNYKDKVRAIWY